MVKFIAEVSSNHNKDLGRMKEFVSVASDIGCDGVKFQLFKIDQLFASEILSKSEKHRDRQEWELDEGYIPELAEFSRSCGLSFSCTPFYMEAVDLLNPYVDFHKIASYELLWLDLFKRCSATGKHIVFSTGMATVDEIECALEEIVKGKTRKVTILHCNSAYPTPVQDANLQVIDALNKRLEQWRGELDINVGWSDHTVSSGVLHRAVHKYGADFIEFHLDLDGKGDEYAAGHCWLPDEIKKTISDIREGEESDGSGVIETSASELADRKWRADPIDGLRPMLAIRESY